MAASEEIRKAVRQQYDFACGYCGVSEIDAGNQLETDHFQPASHGGADELLSDDRMIVKISGGRAASGARS